MTVTVAMASSFHLQAFDKGLRSRSLGDQLSTVVNTSNLLDDNPFPLFVNQVVVKLADAFREGSNELRLCVARVLSECHSHLSLVFSRVEILKKIMIVSHSNDPEARALTLQVLASLAPVFPENKQVHHLIVESLSTESDLEFKSACHAISEFTKLSAEFSNTVIPQIWTLLESPNTSIKRKSLLIPIFGGMKAMVSTTQKVFSMSHTILETYTHTPLICSLLDATTRLAESTRYAIPDQLVVLLSALSRSHDNSALAISALEGLCRLAKHSHVWKGEHLRTLLDCRPHLENRSIVFIKFLNVLIHLSFHARAAQEKFFQEILAELAIISTSSNVRERVAYLQIACNIFCTKPNDNFVYRLMNNFISSLDMPMSSYLSKKYYRALGQFCCSGFLKEEHISEFIPTYLNLPKDYEHIFHLIDFFCRIVDHLPIVVEVVHDWARAAVQVRDDLTDSSIAFLLLAPGISLPSTPEQTVVGGNDWNRYRVARIAFRTGHWRNAALPNLQNMVLNNISYKSAQWIHFLRELAASQLTEFSVKGFQQQNSHLANALSIVNVLLTGIQDGTSFRFPRDFVHCLMKSSRAVLDILCGLSTFQNMPEQFKLPGANLRLRTLIVNANNTFEAVIDQWNQLIRSSYGADYQTHDYIAVLQGRYTVIQNGLLGLIQSSSARATVMPALRVETTSLKKNLEYLDKANSDMVSMHGKEVSHEILEKFTSILKDLTYRPTMIPRFFFQQGDTMKIKLAVVTGTNGEVSVMPGHLYPIQIDGVISSCIANPVHSVTVHAHIHYFISQSNNISYSQVVKPKEGLYFQAQFLLSFKQKCEIEFTVDFTDSKALQTWFSDSKASLRVIINE